MMLLLRPEIHDALVPCSYVSIYKFPYMTFISR
jgi:hypothetical protein